MSEEGAPAFGLAGVEDDDRVIAIERSHLVRGRCRCGQIAIYSPEHRSRAECGTCLAERVGRPDVSDLLGKYEPVISMARPERAEPRAAVGTAAYPRPEWTSRDAMGVPAAGSVLSLVTDAERVGWRVAIQSSRGCVPDGTTGKPTKLRTLHGIRLAHSSGVAAYAVRDESTWRSVVIWGARIDLFVLASITDLREFVAAAGDVPADWFDAIRRRHAAAEVRKATRKACDKGVHAEQGVIGCVTWCEMCGHSWPTINAEPWRKPAASRKREGLS